MCHVPWLLDAQLVIVDHCSGLLTGRSKRRVLAHHAGTRRSRGQAILLTERS